MATAEHKCAPMQHSAISRQHRPASAMLRASKALRWALLLLLAAAAVGGPRPTAALKGPVFGCRVPRKYFVARGERRWHIAATGQLLRRLLSAPSPQVTQLHPAAHAQDLARRTRAAAWTPLRRVRRRGSEPSALGLPRVCAAEARGSTALLHFPAPSPSSLTSLLPRRP